MNVGLDASTIALILGGALGALAHAVFGKDYGVMTKQTLSDVVLGAALGGIIQVIPLTSVLKLAGIDFELPAKLPVLTVAQQGFAMFFMSYACLDVVRDRVLNRFQPLAATQNRRASDPKPPTPEAPK